MEEVVVLEVDEDKHGHEKTCGFGVEWGSSLVRPTSSLLSSSSALLPPSKRRIVSVAAGTNHAALVCSTGDVLVWGRGKEGQLGLGPSVQSLVTPNTQRQSKKNCLLSFAEVPLSVLRKSVNDQRKSRFLLRIFFFFHIIC